MGGKEEVIWVRATAARAARAALASADGEPVSQLISKIACSNTLVKRQQQSINIFESKFVPTLQWGPSQALVP